MEFGVDEEESSKTFSEYVAAIKRRKVFVAVFAIVILIIGVIVTFALPAKYSSKSVILIEGQDIPQDMVRTTITSFAVQRIEEIKQRIMTIGNIMSIVERFGLHSEKELRRLTRSEIANKFRSSVLVFPISAEVVDPRSGRPTEAVIAFSLSFQGKKPDVVQKVTSELTTLFLNENLKERAKQSVSTTEFLNKEADALDVELLEMEQRISDFKDENQGSLPELGSYNINMLDRTEREIIEVNARIRDLETREIELAAELARLSPSAPTILSNGEAVLSDVDRLKALKSEFRRKSSVYRNDHPDLSRLSREITLLEDSFGGGVQKDAIIEQLEISRNRLSEAQDRYSLNHPEVKRLEALVSDLENEADAYSGQDIEITPDNPAYVVIHTRLKSIASEKLSLQQKLIAFQDTANHYKNLLSKTPNVEKDYQALLRNYQNKQFKYQEIRTKLMEAELGRNLEQERKGERFTLIQPPEIPEKPFSPNRRLYIVLSVFFAIALSLGAALVLDAIDPRVFGERAIELETNLSPMVIVPRMTVATEEELVKSFRLKLIILFCGALIALMCSLALFHSYVKPLDVTWFILLRRFGVY